MLGSLEAFLPHVSGFLSASRLRFGPIFGYYGRVARVGIFRQLRPVFLPPLAPRPCTVSWAGCANLCGYNPHTLVGRVLFVAMNGLANGRASLPYLCTITLRSIPGPGAFFYKERASAEAIRKTRVRRVVKRRGNAQKHLNSLKAVRLEYEQRVRFLQARNISLASGILSASRLRIAPALCEGLHFATAKVCFLVHPCRIPHLYSVSGGLRGCERLQPAHPRATVKGALEAEPIR